MIINHDIKNERKIKANVTTKLKLILLVFLGLYHFQVHTQAMELMSEGYI